MWRLPREEEAEVAFGKEARQRNEVLLRGGLW